MIISPLPNKILVSEFKKGERKIGSIILTDDDKKEAGIRPRWAKVYAVGEEIKGLETGDWILIEHGRWSRKMELQDDPNDAKIELWSVEEHSIMMKSKTEPMDELVKDV